MILNLPILRWRMGLQGTAGSTLLDLGFRILLTRKSGWECETVGWKISRRRKRIWEVDLQGGSIGGPEMATTYLALPDLHSLLDRPQFQYYALITTYPFLFHSPQLTHYSLPPPIAMPLSSAFSRGHLLRCISKLNNVKIILSYPPQPNRDAYKQVPLHFFILPSFCLFVNIAM